MALSRCCGTTRKGARCSITASSGLTDDCGRLIASPLLHGGSFCRFHARPFCALSAEHLVGSKAHTQATLETHGPGRVALWLECSGPLFFCQKLSSSHCVFDWNYVLDMYFLYENRWFDYLFYSKTEGTMHDDFLLCSTCWKSISFKKWMNRRPFPWQNRGSSTSDNTCVYHVQSKNVL